MTAADLPRLNAEQMALFADKYSLDMWFAHWQLGSADTPVEFMVLYRRDYLAPYAIMGGPEGIVQHILAQRLTKEQAQFVVGLGYPSEFVAHVARSLGKVSLSAAPEGSVIYPGMGAIRIVGPVGLAQFYEAVILSFFNSDTAYISTASEFAKATEGKVLIDMGIRRGPGPLGATRINRNAYIGGTSGCSNLQGGFIYGVPVMGTVAHAWYLFWGNEELATERLIEGYTHMKPPFLLDTFDTIEGIRTAIRVCKRLNLPMEGSVRLDSGDLGALSKAVEQELIEAGFIILTDGLVKTANSVRVAASNGLTVSRITALRAEQAPIDVYGVGDNIHVLAKPFGGVMKLTSVQRDGQWEPRCKITQDEPGKDTLPGPFEQWVYYNEQGQRVADVIASASEPAPTAVLLLGDASTTVDLSGLRAERLLVPHITDGRFVYTASMEEARERRVQQLAALTAQHVRGISPTLWAIKERIRTTWGGRLSR